MAGSPEFFRQCEQAILDPGVRIIDPRQGAFTCLQHRCPPVVKDLLCTRRLECILDGGGNAVIEGAQICGYTFGKSVLFIDAAEPRKRFRFAQLDVSKQRTACFDLRGAQPDWMILGRFAGTISRTSTLMAISPIAAKGTHDAKTHRATFAASAAVSMDSRPEAFATIPT